MLLDVSTCGIAAAARGCVTGARRRRNNDCRDGKSASYCSVARKSDEKDSNTKTKQNNGRNPDDWQTDMPIVIRLAGLERS